MKSKWMAVMLMAGGAMLAPAQVAVGVQFGRPAPVMAPAPVAVDAYRPPCPGPGYVWIDGYYDQYGNWIEGYWALPPYVGAFWVAPRLVSGRFYAGYWGGSRGIAGPERFAAPAYERGPARTIARPIPERNDHEARVRGNGFDRGADRGGNSRQGFRR